MRSLICFENAIIAQTRTQKYERSSSPRALRTSCLVTQMTWIWKLSQNFIAKLISLQRQFGQRYLGDKFFRDRTLIAVDISSVQTAIPDRISKTTQQLTNCITNRLFSKLKTVGSAQINYAGVEVLLPSDGPMYTLGYSYSRAAGRSVKPFENKEASAN